MDVNVKSAHNKVPINEEEKDGLNEKKLRNFENTFLHDWRRVLKRVDEGRKCCEMLRKIFEEIIRVETEYERNLRNICELFREFDDESCGIKNGIHSLKANIERRCEQIKEFVSNIEGEILNKTLSTTLINHKNVFDQIKIDGIENEKIVERTKKESIKSIENCVNAYESLINAIYVFQNNIYLHPLKKIELSNLCINKYLIAKKKEDEYKNTIHIIKEIELKKEKRVKSILYSLESMDYKRISCIKDNIMKFLIFYTSYIRNVQYDLNTSINIFKDICAFEEIKEYCLTHNKTEKQDIERIIFFTNIVSWPMLIDYLGELNSVHNKGSNISKWETLSSGDYPNDENSPSKRGNIFSSIFNVNIYKNLMQINNKKASYALPNSFYPNIFNEIVFFNKKDTTDEEGNEEAVSAESSSKKNIQKPKKGIEKITGIEKENIADTVDESPFDNSSKLKDTENKDIDTSAPDIIADIAPDTVEDAKRDSEDLPSNALNFYKEEKVEDDNAKIDENKDSQEKREKGDNQNFKRMSQSNEFLETEKLAINTTDASAIEANEKIQIFESFSSPQREMKKEKNIYSSDSVDNVTDYDNDNSNENTNNDNFKFAEDYIPSESEKKRKQYRGSFSTSEISTNSNLSYNIKDDLKKMEIYFFFFLNNLYAGKSDRIANMNITKYFATYNNRFIFCECLMNFIKRKKKKFLFLKSLVLFANVILKFLDHCETYVDYWSAIYILVAAENFYFEVEKNVPVNINLLLSKYAFYDKSKNTNPGKNIEMFNKKKVTEGSLFKGTGRSGARNEKDTGGSDEVGNVTSESMFQKIKDRLTKTSTDVSTDDFNQKNHNEHHNNGVPSEQKKSVVNIYESENSDVISTDCKEISGDNIKEKTNYVEPKNRKEKDQKKGADNYETREQKGNQEVTHSDDGNVKEPNKKLCLHRFLYAHNLWNNIKFWEVCFLVIISEIIQEIILLEKYRYENKEEMIKRNFFFFKYFNFYNSMIKFGLSVNQIGLLLNKIFHHFDLKNDPIARKYFFEIIDITTNKNISLNYIKMGTAEDANKNYKNYYLQYYNNFLNGEKKFKKNT